jgi:hypothetical protein
MHFLFPSFMKKYLLTLLALPFLAASCSKSDKDDPTPSTGPREYQVEYRVTATNATSAQIIYRDETGTEKTDGTQTLPKTYSFKRTMGPSEPVSCGAFLSGSAPANATITSTILIDGKQVKTETGTGASAQAIPVYLIP